MDSHCRTFGDRVFHGEVLAHAGPRLVGPRSSNASAHCEYDFYFVRLVGPFADAVPEVLRVRQSCSYFRNLTAEWLDYCSTGCMVREPDHLQKPSRKDSRL